MSLTPEQINTLETGAKAFNEYKTRFDDLAKKVDHLTNDLAPKMDVFDQIAFKQIAEDVGKAIELSQKEQARAKAIEDHSKALEAEVEALKTAFNRLPADDGKGSAVKSKEMQ